MHIHHVNTLERHNLEQFCQNLLEFVEYFNSYHKGIVSLIYSNPLAKMFWPPEHGWAVTLAQYPEIKLFEKLSSKLKDFVAPDSMVSSIEILLELNAFIEELPDNSLYLLAPGVKEPLGAVEDIVEAAKEILSTKLPKNMTASILARELDLSLASIENHQRLLDGIVLENNGNVMEEEKLQQESSSLQAMAELLSLLANVEKHLCKAYLIDDLLHCLQLNSAMAKEVIAAIEKEQYQVVLLRLEHIRRYEMEFDAVAEINYVPDLFKEALVGEGNEIPMVTWLRNQAKQGFTTDKNNIFRN